MVAIDISNAAALEALKTKLHLNTVEDIFFEAGRVRCRTYSRASAKAALADYGANGERRLPPNVLLLCHDNQIFPIIVI